MTRIVSLRSHHHQRIRSMNGPMLAHHGPIDNARPAFRIWSGRCMGGYLEHPSHSKQILANASDRIGLLHWYCYDIGFGRQFTLGIRHSLSGLVHLAGALDINQADRQLKKFGKQWFGKHRCKLDRIQNIRAPLDPGLATHVCSNSG